MNQPDRPKASRRGTIATATIGARASTAGSAVLSEGAAAAPLAPAAHAPRTDAFAWSRPIIWIVALAVLCAWLLPGTLGHDPWKQDETYTFGIIQHMLQTGDLVVPTNAGQPFVEKPPIYDWVAAGLAWMFGRYLPLHDAARLASALFSGMALFYTARLARTVTGATRWLDLRVIGSVALFASSLVVIKHSHDMMTDVALMAGTTLAFCGLFELVLAHVRESTIDAPRALANNPVWMTGAGVGIALLAKGLFVPLVFGATTVAVMLLYPACRSRSFARSLALATLVLAPFALIWPICFYLRSPELFKVWFWDNNVGRFFGFSVPYLGSGNDGHFFVLRAVLTVGFPVGPLALIALVSLPGSGWRRWLDPRVALPAIFAGIGIAVLQLSATARELYILPFIAPLALLAMLGVERLPQRLHSIWDMTNRLLFGSFAMLVWIVWSTMTGPVESHSTLRLLGRWLPLDWVMPARPVLIGSALLLTAGWLWLLPALRHAGKWRGALSWCLGAILAWGLVSTLLLPWIDEAKSYRAVFEDLGTRLDTEWNDGDCMASVGLGESEAPMLYYFTGVQHMPTSDTEKTECTWLIVQSSPGDAFVPRGDWQPYWSGARHGDDDQLLRVFVRIPRAKTPQD
ncbi:4-amino-4-deoxy-L-arabinose transferase-like glycosyltransferase [Paraburkholderia sp. GAS448]|uniref:ArnT family glycosyltransferase n=1 Tax=Paraburkholderia sp. GAS448 TaxID=3035136 RepID=UPI003D217621